jgi:GMP synthase-like glutamine amidotransferase
MRVHWLQHADFEDLGNMGPWLRAHGHIVSGTRLHSGETPPADARDFEALIVMGGPMNIYEHAHHPWLIAEKALIRSALDADRRVLGICLGAQLIADALGGPVTRNAETEIGWFPLTLTAAGRRSPYFAQMPQSFAVFHWHGDTYALPPGAESLAASAACAQQAFSYDGGRVLGLQFHPEVTRAHLAEWFRHETLVPARWIQSPQGILADSAAFAASEWLATSILETFFG